MYNHELDEALKIVKKAGVLTLRLFNQSIPEELKENRSPVTQADREGERLIARCLQAAFPDDGILGEEGVKVPSKSGRRWLIDPIDGTKDFLRGNPHWTVQLALQIGEQIVVGVVCCPCLDETLFAANGEGAWWNNIRTTASPITQMEKAVLTVSGFNAAWSSWPETAVRELTRRCWTVRCYGGAYNVIMLARGKTDIWLSGRGMEWDYAPAQVISRECGACFMTRDGGACIDEKHAVICAPGLRAELRDILLIDTLGSD